MKYTKTLAGIAFSLLSVGVNAQQGDYFAINAGGGNYRATDDKVYFADEAFVGGNTYQTSSSTNIANTNDDVLYRTERWGNFSYNFPEANGFYEVTLKFAEIYFNAAGKREFGVTAEGEVIDGSLDIVEWTGGKNIAGDMTFTVEVTDGELNLVFIPGAANNPKLSAIYYEPTSAPSDVGVTINAADFDDESNPSDDPNEDYIIRNMTSKVGYIKTGGDPASGRSFFAFDKFNFGAGATHLTVRASSKQNGGRLHVRLRTARETFQNTLAVIDIPATGSWNTFQDFTVELDQAALTRFGPEADLYFTVEQAGNSSGFLFDIQSFRFDNN